MCAVSRGDHSETHSTYADHTRTDLDPSARSSEVIQFINDPGLGHLSQADSKVSANAFNTACLESSTYCSCVDSEI
jgi:hypothetical protein